MDIISERWTLETLKENDRLQKDRVSLKDIIKDLEDEVLANAGVDVFEECFKLIFAKLFDEYMSGQNPARYLEFSNSGRTEYKLKEAIQDLFDQANKKWKDDSLLPGLNTGYNNDDFESIITELFIIDNTYNVKLTSSINYWITEYIFDNAEFNIEITLVKNEKLELKNFNIKKLK